MFNSYVCLPEGNWSSETIIVLHCIESVVLWLCGLVSDFVWNSWYSRSVAENLGYGSQTGRA